MSDPKINSILSQLNRPHQALGKSANGQILIIGGSSLFHGAPLLALKTASRIAGMVFFASPEPSLEPIASQLKASLSSFIWIPWSEVKTYLSKVDSILIGSGFMRFRSEAQKETCEKFGVCGQEAEKTKTIISKLLRQYPEKQWVIDAGGLQLLDLPDLPPRAILTPNAKEYQLLFGELNEKNRVTQIRQMAAKNNCTIIYKNCGTSVVSADQQIEFPIEDIGMNKGGMGDVLAGLTVALSAKNSPFIASASAAFINQKAAEKLHSRVGVVYNADDLANIVPEVLGEYLK